MADRFTSGSCSVKNKFSDWLIKQLLNLIITKYFNLSVSHVSVNPQPLPSADWSSGHRQIMIFFVNLLSWLLRGSTCLTELTRSAKVLLPLEANKICVSIAANICHQVKPEFPLSPMDDNYMYPIIDYYGSETKVLKFLVKHENVIYQKYIHQNSMCSWIWSTVLAGDIVNFAGCSVFFFLLFWDGGQCKSRYPCTVA